MVDTTLRLSGDTWNYWVPEARLVVCSSTSERQRRFVLNWLRVREPWYYLMTHCCLQDNVVEPLKASQWREYLNTSERLQEELASKKNTKHAKTKRQVADIFKKVFGNDILESHVPDSWFGRSIDDLDEAGWTRLSREVAWELSEVGFRHELTELDRYLVPPTQDLMEEHDRHKLIAAVFPADHGLIHKNLPERTKGLACVQIRDRAAYLEGLRIVICRWPCVPPSIKDTTPFTLAASQALFLIQEHNLIQCYCQTFFSVTGRAPILPRVFPEQSEVIEIT